MELISIAIEPGRPPVRGSISWNIPGPSQLSSFLRSRFIDALASVCCRLATHPTSFFLSVHFSSFLESGLCSITMTSAQNFLKRSSVNEDFFIGLSVSLNDFHSLVPMFPLRRMQSL